MNQIIKVAIVNYLNTTPFIYGLKHGPLNEKIKLIECIPSECASLYQKGLVDLSLVPVGAIHHVSDQRISDFGIASDGPVASVCILSEVPLDQITSVYLDYQSRTSVLLARLLFHKFWKLNPFFLNAKAGYEVDIKGNKAGLVIGDRALALKSKYSYVFDLGLAWKEYASLPFVYAVWLQTRKLPSEFIELFNQSLALGVSSIPSIVKNHPAAQQEMLSRYFSENIHYPLTPAYDQGLEQFLSESQIYATEMNAEGDRLIKESA
ncbi:MAG: menaquinone biosynthesis protein [Saprospiraceae bacterium]